jgi:hypothetical protein
MLVVVIETTASNGITTRFPVYTTDKAGANQAPEVAGAVKNATIDALLALGRDPEKV